VLLWKKVNNLKRQNTDFFNLKRQNTDFFNLKRQNTDFFFIAFVMAAAFFSPNKHVPVGCVN
jgi:hypothetical protein